MKLTAFNGSPRGKTSNSNVLLKHFLDGFMTTNGNSFELAHLTYLKEHDKYIELFRKADHVLFAMPLYFDSMPSNVKAFIELLEPYTDRQDNPAMSFIVQSGFPEPGQSRYLERYLKKFADRMNSSYKGTIIRGSVEAIRIYPLLENVLQKFIVNMGSFTNMCQVGGFFNAKKLYKQFYQLGITFGQTGEFDKDITFQLVKPEKLTKLGFWLFKSVGDNLYWNNLLKNNNVYKRRSDTPYV